MNTTMTAAATYPATKAGARRFLKAALEHVESASIRTWATSNHNGPVWEREALAWLKKERTDVLKFAALIVIEAMGA